MNQPDYTDNPKKRRSWIKISIGIAALLGFSACTWMFVGMFKESLEFQKTATAFIEQAEGGNFPAAAEWSPEAGVTDAGVRELSEYVAAYGALREIEKPDCTVSFYKGTERMNGRFVTCLVQTHYENGAGETKIIWRMENEDWKLLGYHTNFGPGSKREQSALDAPSADKGKKD